MSKHISRRQLLQALAAAAGSLGLGALTGCIPSTGRAEEGLQARTYMPVVTNSTDSPTEPPPTQPPPTEPSPTQPPPTEPPPTQPPPTEPPPATASRVVHVRDVGVTSWDYGNSYYGNYVNQARVDTMVDRGVMALTHTSSVAQAWQTLVPDYAPGKGIAIKVNFNNNYQTCDSNNLDLDALIHPVNAIVKGLLAAYPDFRQNDIWVYDATGIAYPEWGPRNINTRFQDGCLYPGVRYFDYRCNEKAGYTSNDPSAIVTWSRPGLPSGVKVTDVLVDATYLINIPILKRHWATGVTFGFKNHFGSIENCYPLHDWVYNGSKYYSAGHSPIVDIYLNANIAGKTVLVMGDMLFGNWENNYSKAKPWVTFGNAAPDSLLFATDPVAIDCVMCDLLASEESLLGISDHYLLYASSLGLGTYERGDPWGSGYSHIDYVSLS